MFIKSGLTSNRFMLLGSFHCCNGIIFMVLLLPGFSRNLLMDVIKYALKVTYRRLTCPLENLSSWLHPEHREPPKSSSYTL